MIKKIIFIIVIAVVAYYGSKGLLNLFKKYPVIITDFKSCQKAGRPIMESYPRQCRGLNGQNYVEEVSNQELNTDPVVNSPDLSKPISSPLNISGEARGSWFFEGVFPIKLIDNKGNLVATGTARAKGEWMTSDFVQFSATLNFKNPSTESGELILSKDNPSGMKQYDREIRLPIFFQKINETLMKNNSTENKAGNPATSTGSTTNSR